MIPEQQIDDYCRRYGLRRTYVCVTGPEKERLDELYKLSLLEPRLKDQIEVYDRIHRLRNKFAVRHGLPRPPDDSAQHYGVMENGEFNIPGPNAYK